MSILGTRVERTEDPRLLTVGGTNVDDLRVPELDVRCRLRSCGARWRTLSLPKSTRRRPGARHE